MNFRSPRDAQSGFSIIEMMVGVALVTISFVGMAPLVISTNHVTETVAENELARSAARAKLDELRNVPYANLSTNYVNHTFDIDLDGDGQSDLRQMRQEGGTTRTGTTSGGGGTTGNTAPATIPVGSVTIDEVPGGEVVGEALRIQVVLRWSSRQGPQEYRLHTIRARD